MLLLKRRYPLLPGAVARASPHFSVISPAFLSSARQAPRQVRLWRGARCARALERSLLLLPLHLRHLLLAMAALLVRRALR